MKKLLLVLCVLGFIVGCVHTTTFKKLNIDTKEMEKVYEIEHVGSAKGPEGYEADARQRPILSDILGKGLDARVNKGV